MSRPLKFTKKKEEERKKVNRRFFYFTAPGAISIYVIQGTSATDGKKRLPRRGVKKTRGLGFQRQASRKKREKMHLAFQFFGEKRPGFVKFKRGGCVNFNLYIVTTDYWPLYLGLLSLPQKLDDLPSLSLFFDELRASFHEKKGLIIYTRF